MDQPVLTATLALAIAAISTAAVAIVTLAAERLGRAMNLTVVGAIITVAAVALQRADLRINFTSSMPVGIYVLSPLPPDGAARGMLVAACTPARAVKKGRQRGYLAVGPCASDTELLLKSIAAIAGDDVGVSAAGITVNGQLLPDSRAVVRDRAGRRLTPWPRGLYRLGAGKVWLYADDPRSWDSRYWGPVPTDDVPAGASPLLILPRAFALRLMIRVPAAARGRPDGGVVRPAPGNRRPGCVKPAGLSVGRGCSEHMFVLP
jgi:conjugative transfer signal peptidase TraF